MNPMLVGILPHPDPLPLAAPVGLSWILLNLTFFLHVVAMNFVLGGSIISLTLGGQGNEPRARLRAFLAKAMPPMIAATVTLGVAPLLLTQVLYGRLFFSSSILMAWSWGSVVFLLILAYYGAYLISFKGERLGGARTVVLALTTLLLLAIAWIYTSNMSLMLSPQGFSQAYATDPSGWQMSFAEPTLVPRLLHMVFGALAVAGLIIAVYGCFRRTRDEPGGSYALRVGSNWFLGATAVNLIIGCWWLIALPREIMLRFMGSSALASASLGLGIILGLASLALVLVGSRTKTPTLPMVSGAVLAGLTVFGMVFARSEVRDGALAIAGFEPVRWVQTQWGPLVIFLVLLVVAVVTVTWMVVKLARSPAASPRENS